MLHQQTGTYSYGGTDNTVGGSLSVTATAGGITDSATIAVTGDLTLNDVATAGITLDTLEADANVILTAAEIPRLPMTRP